jgi:DNA-directed RNA polymerase subunit F
MAENPENFILDGISSFCDHKLLTLVSNPVKASVILKAVEHCPGYYNYIVLDFYRSFFEEPEVIRNFTDKLIDITDKDYLEMQGIITRIINKIPDISDKGNLILKFAEKHSKNNSINSLGLTFIDIFKILSDCDDNTKSMVFPLLQSKEIKLQTIRKDIVINALPKDSELRKQLIKKIADINPESGMHLKNLENTIPAQ